MQCTGTTVVGKQCSRTAQIGATRCSQHSEYSFASAAAGARAASPRSRAHEAFDVVASHDVGRLLGVHATARFGGLDKTTRASSPMKHALAEQRATEARIVVEAGSVRQDTLGNFLRIVVRGTRRIVIHDALIAFFTMNGRLKNNLKQLVWLCIKKRREDVLRELVDIDGSDTSHFDALSWSQSWSRPTDSLAFCEQVFDAFGANVLEEMLRLLLKQSTRRAMYVPVFLEEANPDDERWGMRLDVAVHVVRIMRELETM
jgi:hypothetical protein